MVLCSGKKKYAKICQKIIELDRYSDKKNFITRYSFNLVDQRIVKTMDNQVLFCWKRTQSNQCHLCENETGKRKWKNVVSLGTS